MRTATWGNAAIAGAIVMGAVTIGCGDADNRPPQATAKTVQTFEDTPVGFTFEGFDADNDAFFFEIVDRPVNGRLQGVLPNVSYEPDENFNGTDRVTFRANDGDEFSAVAEITLEVAPVNDAPVLAPLSDRATLEDMTVPGVEIEVSDVDSDLGNVSVTVLSGDASIVDGSGLTLSGADDAYSLDIAPVADANGAVTITVFADDGDLTSEQSFTVTYLEVNDAPTVTAIGDQTTQQAAVGPVAFTVGDIESDPAALTVTATSSDQTVLPDSNIAIGGAGALRDITAAPAAGGTSTVTVTVEDGSDSVETTFLFTSTNRPPTAAADLYATRGNTPLTVGAGAGVTFNDSDLDGDGFTLTPIVAGATAMGGVINLAADGSFDYTPPTGAEGVNDSFDYQIFDGLEMATGTATIALGESVWYVDNQAAGDGSLGAPFATLAQAETAGDVGDTIFVFEGDGTTLGMDAGIGLADQQELIGQGVDLVLDGQTVVAAAGPPQITHTAGNAVDLDDNNVIRGITIMAPSGDGVSGPSIVSLTVSDVLIDSAGADGFDIGSSNPAVNVVVDISDTVIRGNLVDFTTTAQAIDIVVAGTGPALLATLDNLDIDGVVEGIVIDVDGAAGGAGTANSISITSSSIVDVDAQCIDLKPSDLTVSQFIIDNNTLTGFSVVANTANDAVLLSSSLEGGDVGLTVTNNTIDAIPDGVIVLGATTGGLGAGMVRSLIDSNTFTNVTLAVRVAPDDALMAASAVENNNAGTADIRLDFVTNTAANSLNKLAGNTANSFILTQTAPGAMQLEGTEATADAEIAATNTGTPAVSGTVTIVAPGSVPPP